MLFEQVLVFILFGTAIFTIGIPLTKLVKRLIPQKRDPLEAAQEELEVARREAEAARLKKETEKIYSQMYTETLEDSESSDEERSRKRL